MNSKLIRSRLMICQKQMKFLVLETVSGHWAQLGVPDVLGPMVARLSFCKVVSIFFCRF